MDPQVVKEIMDYKIQNCFPEGLTKHQRYTIKRRASTFVLKNGVLHYICRRRQDKAEHLAKVVLSATEADAIFQEFHCSSLGAHCGVEKTHNAIISCYYWPGMEADIRKWVAQSPDCQAKRASLKEKSQYNPIEVTQPFELVGMDLVKLTVTERGNQYICVMADYFTKWAEAYPLKSKSAEEVTNCILDFVYKFGAPQRLLTDQGTEFKNQVNARCCEALGIHRCFCSPYHPQTNGLVEKLNGTIQRSLNKLARRNPQKWDQFLQPTMFGLRTKKQLTTQHSPYYLMFGREARYPSEVPQAYEVTEERVEHLINNEKAFEGLQNLTVAYKKVRQNVLKGQEKIRRRKIDRGLEENFQVGDVVLKKNIREQQRKGGKMESDMLGPFTITNIKQKIVYLSSANSKTIANVDQLTHCTEPEERIPAKLKKFSNSPLARPPPQPPSSPNTPPRAISSPGPLPATPQGTGEPIHSLVKDLWTSQKGEVLWAKLGPYKLFTSDLQCLAPGRELESETINAYLLWATKQVPNTKIRVIDSFEMTAIWDGTPRGMRKLNVMEWDVLIGAVCKNRHWTLVAMYPNDRRALFVDPFGATITQLKHCRDATRAFMRKKNMGLNLSRWSCETVEHPRQQDFTSCGVLICKVAELLLKGSSMNFDVNEESINSMRMEMARRLMDGSDNLKELCRICGEEESGDRDPSDEPVDQWIECTVCSRWFHWVCVARPNMDEIFVCPACPPLT